MKKLLLFLAFCCVSLAQAQYTAIPDVNFEKKLIELKLDDVQDGKVLTANINKETYLDISNASISDLTGIEAFVALQDLKCSNNQLTTLDLSLNAELSDIWCENNKIKDLKLGNIKYLYLWISNNQISNIDFLVNVISVELLFCDGNLIKTLDFSNPKFKFNDGFDFSNNPFLEYVNFKSGMYQMYFIDSTALENCPKLQFICVDNDELSDLNVSLSKASNTTCSVSTYCSFTPGGTFYTLKGAQKWDANNNGCDAQDGSIPNLKYNINNGNLSQDFISDTSENYNVALQAGNYTITPVFENPTYFIANPASFTANFPTQTSPLIQDICITPNGVHHDVEAVLIPAGKAIPGYYSHYTITCKNNGTQSESGQITLAFDDTVMDFVSASISPLKVKNGLLTFDYSVLKPFESKNIYLVFKMNSPTDIPALNNGDVLTFVATISGNAPEETPLDNVSTLKQSVRNSFDPNDKTCLEGNTVTPELVGKYVHYVVRFENTGTLAAKNIVVKDMIDTSKFDVNSLIVTNSSHSCVTKISDTNKVEFIFENINLPFDNATNDGYIAFKIKTLPSLKVGDTFSNTADIFFDYNFPITTNEAKTTVEVLSTSDFAFENYFSLYPNPAKNTVSLSSKNSIEVKNINVFNTLGQLVLSIPNAHTVSNFDVSRLNTGTYFVKIATNKGTSTTKFIKE